MSRRKIITAAVWFLLLISVSVILYSGYQLREVLSMYREGDQSYELLRQQVGYGVNTNYTDDTNRHRSETSVEIPPVFIDFEALKQINPDAVAWLYCPDTAIDYPVMRADDYNWYLNHLPDGTCNANGTLFLDCNSPGDFSGGLSIIYGHHMKSGKMFGSLKGYRKQNYFERHPRLFLYTAQGDYQIDLIYGCVIGANEWRDKAFMYEINRGALLEYASSKSTFESRTVYTKDDRFIVLATCSYEFDDARYIVIGVLRPEN